MKTIKFAASSLIMLAGTILFCRDVLADSTPHSPLGEMMAHGNYTTGQLMFDRLEVARSNDNHTTAVWDVQGWYGGDYHRVVVKTEGENTRDDGEPTHLERAEVLYSYLVSTFWSVQAGVGLRGELGADNTREHYMALGIQGLAPYWFEMDNTLLINEQGNMQAISEVEYDWVLTQRSFLQPRMELTVNLTDANEYNREAGFSHVRMGLRYRYEINRKLAPYAGVYWDKWLGQDANTRQQRGESTSETGFVIGIRAWF